MDLHICDTDGDLRRFFPDAGQAGLSREEEVKRAGDLSGDALRTIADLADASDSTRVIVARDWEDILIVLPDHDHAYYVNDDGSVAAGGLNQPTYFSNVVSLLAYHGGLP